MNQIESHRVELLLPSRIVFPSLESRPARARSSSPVFISSAWFRHQLLPSIDFARKQDNLTGLQLADLLARPCAEKVVNPTSTPRHRQEFRTKLCPGVETAHSTLGIKIVPWDDLYVDIWKS